MPTRGEEKLRSTEATRGDGSSWLWVTSMTRGLCWHDSSYIPARQGKERSDSSNSMDLLLVYHLHPPHANRPAGRAEDPARGAGDSSERSQPWWRLWVSLLVSRPTGCSPKERFRPSVSVSWTATTGLCCRLGTVPEEARKTRREVGTAGLSKQT